MSKDKEQLSEQVQAEEELAKRARDSVRDARLPDDVKRRLRLARAEAVEQVGNTHAGTFFGSGRWLLPAGAAASLALAVVLVGNNHTEVMPVLDEQELAAATEMDLLDDIEFLAWMLEEEGDEAVPDDS